MFSYASKIQKEETEKVSEIEKSLATAMFEVEKGEGTKVTDKDMDGVVFNSAEELELSDGKRVVVVKVPYRLLDKYRKIHLRLTEELEKRMGGTTVLFVGKRKILPSDERKLKVKRQKRPYSRTLTAVHDAILDDIIYPSEVVGRRTRYRLDGSRKFKVYLPSMAKKNVENRLEAYSTAYKKLTGKDVVFDFPPSS